jgi:hypothetical protein
MLKGGKIKAVWWLIYTEARNLPSYDHKIQLKTETGTVTNMQNLRDLNSYSVKTVHELMQQNNCYINTQIV